MVMLLLKWRRKKRRGEIVDPTAEVQVKVCIRHLVMTFMRHEVSEVARAVVGSLILHLSINHLMAIRTLPSLNLIFH
jgi:hypothetical protein